MYRDDAVIIVYCSSYNRTNLKNQTSKVKLVCNENDIYMRRFEFGNELSTRFYQLKLFKQYACPEECISVKKECIMRDSCSCEMSFINTLMEDTLISDWVQLINSTKFIM